MKWENKGHEYDGLAKRLQENFREKDCRFYVFGAGTRGDYVRNLLEWYQCFAGFIDNDNEKQKAGKNGACVLSLEKFIDEGYKGSIVVAVDQKYISDIVQQLIDIGLKENRDFYLYSDFLDRIFPVLSLYEYGKLYTETTQICLTERCSLKCKHCAHACYNVPADAQDLSLEVVKQSADTLFSKVDRMREFVLLGGEPFLYEHLDEVIAYIGKEYRDRMLTFCITSNGTIVPSTDTLELCKQYNVLIRISNYTASIPRLEKQYEKLCKALEAAGVTYFLGEKEYVWMDYGFGRVDRKASEEELINVFDACKTPCREIRGEKLYFCVQARSSAENLGFHVGKTDYLNLEECNNKRVILEFLTGYSDKGYLDMCNYCNGADAVNYPIPVAEQK